MVQHKGRQWNAEITDIIAQHEVSNMKIKHKNFFVKCMPISYYSTCDGEHKKNIKKN